jgi:hypothetical protein
VLFPIVKKYFDKAFKSKNNLVQLYAVVALAKYKIAAPDSVLLKLAANRLYAFNLYQLLGSVHATVFFPTKFNTQEHLMYSQLFYKGEYKLVDTVVFLKRVNVEAKKVKGVVNVYKYRLDNDGPWYFALCGIQPSNVNQTNYNDIISAVKTQIDDKQPLQKQIDKAVSIEVLKYLTNSSNFFMRNSSTSMDD